MGESWKQGDSYLWRTRGEITINPNIGRLFVEKKRGNPRIDCAGVAERKERNILGVASNDPSQFSSFVRADSFLSVKRIYIYRSVSYQSIDGPLPIRDKNKQAQESDTFPFLHQRLFLHPSSFSLSLSLPCSRTLRFPLVPCLSHPCATASRRGVCSGSLTCCMLFCPGPSAILVF